MFYNFNNDIRDTREGADLFDLVKSFKNKIGFPSNYNASLMQVYALIQSAPVEETDKIMTLLDRYAKMDPSLIEDPFIKDFKVTFYVSFSSSSRVLLSISSILE